MLKLLRPALGLTLFFLVVIGFAFPFAIYGVAQAMFPHQANGSMIVRNGETVGSELIGQNFSGPEFFHLRPSAAGNGYDAANSGGTNLGPTSDKLINGVADGSFLGVRQLAAQYRTENGMSADAVVPVDAVTRSGSGLDPHISVLNARVQAPRVARENGITLDEVDGLIEKETEPRFAAIFGEPCVNVLKLNLSILDK